MNKLLASGAAAALLCLLFSGAPAAESPHGLAPAGDMPFIPDLGGLRHKAFKNQYGQQRELSEAVLVRKSSVKNGKATVPAGGLCYISETQEDAAPFRRDPFLLLGEHAYLVDSKTSVRSVRNVSLKKGEKVLVDNAGYRLWFDYATDHYDLPYIQMALIAPSGHWPMEFSVSSKFPAIKDLPDRSHMEGDVEQLDEFFLDPVFEYGASRFEVKDHDFQKATFSSLSYPVIDEATFSLSRPVVLDLRQEEYRLYGTKRIYAFRESSGFRVRVTNLGGDKILAEKLLRPISSQGYKDAENEKDAYSLTVPGEDMRVEIAVQPEWLRHSDFMPWSDAVPHDWSDGMLSLVVYRDLVTVKNGEPWPLDPRYTVGLEASLLTGKLQRLTLENAEPFTLDDKNDSYDGPVKYSDVWNRPAFRLVADDIEGDKVKSYYVRDAFFQRTDNLSFTDRGRRDIDCFIGRAPTFVSILEDSFLTRLATPKFGTEVEGSHFTSFPSVMPNMAFHSPDPTAPFGGLMRGFGREQVTNRRGERLTSSEGLVIRGSYVDWKNNRIVIPPAGLFYTSRNARNVRALNGETFYMLGRRAYIATFESTTFTRRNFDIDFWRVQPDASLHPIYWQDQPLGVNNKVLRFTEKHLLDDRPMAQINVVKYSGNNFGAPFELAQGLSREQGDRYYLHDRFAEGATWIEPEFVGEDYVRVKSFGTPAIKSVEYTYEKPVRALLAPGEEKALGKNHTLSLVSFDEAAGTATVEIRRNDGSLAKTRTLGPLNAETRAFLPQHQRVVNSLQFAFDEGKNKVLAEMDVKTPFEKGKAAFYTYTDLKKLEGDTPFEGDPRFMVRPDVCGHCYQLNEVLLDNPEPIILDREHPRFDGPRMADGKPQFSIVIDSFDGEMIHAWHIETNYRKRVFKSANLAFQPRNNIDVLMGVNGTIEGFLRASLMERSAWQEYWRTGAHPHSERGLDAWLAHKFQ